MAARMRVGWCVVVLIGIVGRPGQAGPISPQGGFRGQGDTRFRNFSQADLSTLLPMWPGAPWTWNFSPVASIPLPAADPMVAAPMVAAPMVAAPVPSAAPMVVAPVMAVAAPVATPAPAPVVLPAPSAVSIPSVAAPAAPSYDAFINMGNGPYPEASLITTGNAQPWSSSPQIVSLFGGQPTAQQQSDFTSTVLQRVEQTFENSGISVNLTTNPLASAAHTLSLVSNTSALIDPSAIGMTDLGSNGFSFIDNEAKSSQNINQLERIVAHNLSHELMLSFGVGENYDQSGNFIDARNANWSMMTNPNATFSSAAAAAINAALAAADSPGSDSSQQAQVLGARGVPEPATFLVWGAGIVAIALTVGRRFGRRSQVSQRRAIHHS